MKKIKKNFANYLIFLLLNCALAGTGNCENLAQLFAASTLKAPYVMVGDSITNAGPWQDLFSRLDIANRGIGGDTSTQILQRINSILSLKPKKAFLMFGINDFAQGADANKVFQNYIEIVTRLRKAKVEVFISSTLKCSFNQLCKDGKINEKVESLNALLQNFSKQNHITFININEKLSDKALGLQSKYTVDGVHLNIDGYIEWAKMLASYIN